MLDSLVLILLGILCAFTYVQYMFGTGNVVGEQPRLQPSFVLGQHVLMRSGCLYVGGFHMHHWMFFSIVMIPCIMYRQPFLISWCCVLIVHGLNYSDRFTIEDAHDR
jgi:hypothetical protein